MPDDAPECFSSTLSVSFASRPIPAAPRLSLLSLGVRSSLMQVVLFLALQLSAVAAGAQLLASAPAAVYGPAASLAGWLTGSASSTAAAAEEPPGEPAGASSAASAADPQPPWLKLGLSVLEVAAPELKAKVPLLLGGLRVAGAVADDLAVFLVALILTRCIGAGSVLPGAAAAAAG